MARFNLDDYVDVAERITLFYEKYPAGKVLTELLNVNTTIEKQTQFIVQAHLYDGEVLLASGLAEESFSPQGANVTSPLENAETSAIGRACANLGMATMRNGKIQRPSKQEMAKVQRGTNVSELTPKQTILRESLSVKFPENPMERKEFMEAVLDREVLGYNDVLPDEIDLLIKALSNADV